LDDGYLSLVGRIKELINRGGAKIAPRDIDELLLAHGVVREAMMCGVPDAEYGERVEAAVVVTSSVTLAELSRHCADRLVRFKLPARVRVVREIPVGPTGKVERASVAQPAGFMRVAVVGAGAIGGYVGGMLAHGGTETRLDRVRGARRHDSRRRAADDGGRRRVQGPPARDRRPRGEGARGHRVSRAEGPQYAEAGALLGDRTPAIAAQNGGPWRYFYGHGGSAEGSVSGASTAAARCPWRSRRSARSDAWCIARQRLRCRA